MKNLISANLLLFILNCFVYGQNSPPELTSVGGTPIASGYIPNTLYNIVVNFNENSNKRSFTLMIFNQANPASVGSVEAVNSNVTVNTQNDTLFVSSATVSSLAAWNFRWTSPAAANETITFALMATAEEVQSGTSDVVYTCIYQATNSSFARVGSCSNSMQTGIFSPASRNADISLFPNPATEFITISYTAVQQQNTQIEIYDLSGKLMGQVFNGVEQQGECRHQVDVNGWTSGIYLVKTEFNGSVYYEKFSVR